MIANTIYVQYCTDAGVPYSVSIAAVNRAGPGEFSVFIHFTRELGIRNIIITDGIIIANNSTV